MSSNPRESKDVEAKRIDKRRREMIAVQEQCAPYLPYYTELVLLHNWPPGWEPDLSPFTRTSGFD